MFRDLTDLTFDPKGVARQWLADFSYCTSSEPSDDSHKSLSRCTVQIREGKCTYKVVEYLYTIQGPGGRYSD